jgi:hypothetical protein
MATRKPTDLHDDAIAREVDKLLRKLPGADPYLRGDPDPAVSGPRQAVTSASTPGARIRPGRAPHHRPTTQIQRVAVWVRVVLAALLGVLVLQWPYAHACGLGLGLYLTSLSFIVLGGAWGGVWSWRYRMGLAHATSIVVICWGIALSAHEVLKRNGYAVVTRTWSCVSR